MGLFLLHFTTVLFLTTSPTASVASSHYTFPTRIGRGGGQGVYTRLAFRVHADFAPMCQGVVASGPGPIARLRRVPPRLLPAFSPRQRPALFHPRPNST